MLSLLAATMLSTPSTLEAEARQFAAANAIHTEPTAVFHTQQAWRAAPEEAFRPGAVLLYLEPERMHVVAALEDIHAKNTATQLNQPTWQLGDVFEIFLQLETRPEYFEIHITPENQRLQLRWTPEALELFRRKEKPLEDVMIGEADWIGSKTQLVAEKELWLIAADIPWSVLGIEALPEGDSLLFAFCRYDVQEDGTEVLSATPEYPKPNYHLYDHWHRLRLPPGK